MRAIVTGGAGFIGSHLVDRLVADGHVVQVIDKATGPSIQQSPIPQGRVDAIFHLASPVGPVGVLDWAGKLAPEVVNTSRIVGLWATTHGCPLIYVSTSEVYGSGTQDAEDDVCTFQPETSARKEYAVAKLAAETMLRNTPDLDVRIIRPFNVAGPRQKPDGGFVLPRFIGQALRGEPLTVYAPGSQMRAFTHVADIVDGLLLALERGQPGGVWNLGNPDNLISIESLASEVLDLVWPDGEYRIVDPVTIWGPAFREAPDKIPDPSRAMAELGWRPTRDRASIIRETADAMRGALMEVGS